MSIGDQELVTRACRGDVAAFSKLVRVHSDLVSRVALRILGSDAAQDACQEVWIRVWASMKSFRGESSFSTWLHRITVNTCLSFQKRELRRKGHETEEMPYLPEQPGEEADPEMAALNSERRGELRVALSNVRAEHRTALVLRYMEGMSYVKIAEVLGVPDGTVRGWASRGRATMLVALTQEHAPGDRIIRPRNPGLKTIPQSAVDAAANIPAPGNCS